jgi:hypothetical protein
MIGHFAHSARCAHWCARNAHENAKDFVDESRSPAWMLQNTPQKRGIGRFFHPRKGDGRIAGPLHRLAIDLGPAIAAIEDMVANAADRSTGRSGHGQIVAHTAQLVKK